jgi:hypothetical protein
MNTTYPTYVPDPYAAENILRTKAPDLSPLPSFAKSRDQLPQPFWAGHESAIACYWKAWEIAFRNLRQPTPENGFVSPYIDTAFNDHLFMWDSAFILMFARYGRGAFDFQQTLDNLYAKQHPDGFICREIREEDGSDTFMRFDPPATGPNIMPWSEWEYYINSGDKARLATVFPTLLAFQHWMRRYRTWPDGTYWACGWACGMDNQPRLRIIDDHHRPSDNQPLEFWDTGHMAWIDTCLQAVFSARILLRMANVLGRQADVTDLQPETDNLTEIINATMWDDAKGFYYDRRADGSLSTVKTVGAFWALLAGVLPPDRLARLVGHLNDPVEFNRPHRVPSLSADHPSYHPLGEYWRGGVWAPTDYMVLRGLTQTGHHDLAHEIGCNHHTNVIKVFEQTGTVWENYAPESATQGNIAKDDFVGWSGLPPVAVLFEYVFGLRPDVLNNKLIWDVRLTEAHGVTKYPFGENGRLDLHCEARSSAQEKPVIQVKSNLPVTLEIYWEGGTETRIL